MSANLLSSVPYLFLGNDLFDQFGRDDLMIAHNQMLHRVMAQKRDLAGVALSLLVHLLDGLGGQQASFSMITGLLQAEFDEFSGLLLIKGIKHVLDVDAVHKIAHPFDARQQFQLGEYDQLQKFVFVSLIIQQRAQYLQLGLHKFLPFIDDQDDRLFLIDALVEQIFLDGFAVVDGGTKERADAEEFGQVSKKLIFRLEGRVEDHVKDEIVFTVKCLQ